MGDEAPPRQLSLIPYPSVPSEIVLRRGNTIVVYDPDSRQLIARDATHHAVELLDECPYCHRPLRHEYEEDESSSDHPRTSFVNPDYFRMLAQSQRGSPSSSGFSTPRRRVFQPALRSGTSRNVSGADTPTATEFVSNERSPSGSGQGINSSAFIPGYFKHNFIEERELGRGGKGVVLLVNHVMDGVYLGQFACKRVPVGDNHEWLEKVLVEVTLLQKLRHKNIVAYQWAWLEDYQSSTFGPSIPCLWIIQEYCNAGDVHDYVLGPTEDQTSKEKLKAQARRRSKGEVEQPRNLHRGTNMSFDEIFSFFRDITSGLHHLHIEGYIHRDLKPRNCLLHRDGNKVRVLISDFGEVQSANAQRGSTGATGTISYCAPEVLRRDKPDGAFGNFTTKSDIFSLGMSVYFMCFGRLPYMNANDIEEDHEDLDLLRAEITAWGGFNAETRQRPDLPEKLYRFLKRLLSVNPDERPSTEDILLALRAGAGLQELSDSITDDGRPRIVANDLPARKPGQTRKPSHGLSRSGVPSLSRHHSNNSAQHSRSRSPVKHDHSQSRTNSPLDSSVIMRPRTVELARDQHDLPPPQQSPRLMLPPPERPLLSKAVRLASHPNAVLVFRALLFLSKLLSLSIPCSPYAANSWLLYPLLGLAALDIGALQFRWRQSLLLLGVHILLVSTALPRGRLCARQSMGWEDF